MSSNLNIKTEKFGLTERHKFGKINEVMEIPYLVEVQKNSYQSFITKGMIFLQSPTPTISIVQMQEKTTQTHVLSFIFWTTN